MLECLYGCMPIYSNSYKHSCRLFYLFICRHNCSFSCKHAVKMAYMYVCRFICRHAVWKTGWHVFRAVCLHVAINTDCHVDWQTLLYFASLKFTVKNNVARYIILKRLLVTVNVMDVQYSKQSGIRISS